MIFGTMIIVYFHMVSGLKPQKGQDFSENLLVLAMDINYSEDLSGLKYEDL
jgi:hypothetical protein